MGTEDIGERVQGNSLIKMYMGCENSEMEET